jgi:hypothetical protein
MTGWIELKHVAPLLGHLYFADVENPKVIRFVKIIKKYFNLKL